MADQYSDAALLSSLQNFVKLVRPMTPADVQRFKALLAQRCRGREPTEDDIRYAAGKAFEGEVRHLLEAEDLGEILALLRQLKRR